MDLGLVLFTGGRIVFRRFYQRGFTFACNRKCLPTLRWATIMQYGVVQAIAIRLSAC